MPKLSDIFTIRNSKSLELINCDQDVFGIPFVSRTSETNGTVARVKILDDLEPMPGNAITVALGGSVLASFYQPEPFYTSFHIACLYPKMDITVNEMLYYCTIIEANKYRYSYGRQANKTLKNISVPSPAEISKSVKNYQLDNRFLEKPLSQKKLTLEPANWKWFRYDEAFTIEKGYYNKKPDEVENGKIIFIGATESNNGITSRHNEEDVEKFYEGNCVTVSNNGSVGNAFYQEIRFTCSHDVNVLRPKKGNWNQYSALFVCMLVEKEKYRWAYGRKWRPARMPDSTIRLPVTPEGVPNWQWMEDYIKSLPYSASI